MDINITPLRGRCGWIFQLSHDADEEVSAGATTLLIRCIVLRRTIHAT